VGYDGFREKYQKYFINKQSVAPVITMKKFSYEIIHDFFQYHCNNQEQMS